MPTPCMLGQGGKGGSAFWRVGWSSGNATCPYPPKVGGAEDLNLIDPIGQHPRAMLPP